MTGIVILLVLVWLLATIYCLLGSSTLDAPRRRHVDFSGSPELLFGLHDKQQVEEFAAIALTNRKHQPSNNRYGVSGVKLRLPTPVIVVGYPKSGTTSVWHFFHCSGVKTQHFCCCGSDEEHPPCPDMARCIIQNMRSNVTKMLHGCGEYDVYAQIDGERWIQRLKTRVYRVPLENGTDEIVGLPQHDGPKIPNYEMRHFLPQHFHLVRIHTEYPQATFILPLRDPYEWAHSVFNWFEMRGRIINEYVHQSSGRIQRPGKDKAVDFLARIYQEHTDMVRRLVRQHPSQHALVEFRIDDPQAGLILARAFGLSSSLSLSCWQEPKNRMGDRAKVGRHNYTWEKTFGKRKTTMVGDLFLG